MRKYQQLLLLIISIICVITLLFYRNEYLKLRSVLNVLNFFGNVDINDASCLVFSSDLKSDITFRYRFSEPRSTWTKLDDHYIYSSFWQDSADGGSARTLTVGPKSSFYNYKCRIWFEVGNIIESENGIFEYILDPLFTTDKLGETRYKYFLKCTVRNKPEQSIPYGVLWISPSNSSRILSPIFYKKKSTSEPVVCVFPDYSALPKTDIIEFITYYNFIGVSHFIIYDSGIQHSIFPFLESVVSRDELIRSISVLQWNFPISNSKLERQSLIDDCLSRTFGISELIGIVSWNEYIFPMINNFIKLKPPNKITDLIDMTVNTVLCCTDYADNKVSATSWPMFLRKTRCKVVDNEEKLYFNLKSYEKINKRRIYKIPKETAILRRYDMCDKLSRDFTTDIPISKFYNQIISHKLLRLWKSHLNTTSIYS
ncbi:hypothetical protein PGB90_008767 [Kerria lacca]